MKISKILSVTLLLGVFATCILAVISLAQAAPNANRSQARPAGGAPDDSPWSCGEGPVSMAEMRNGGGFPKARAVLNGSGYHQFYFARAMYTDRGRGDGGYLGDRGPAWSTDYPNSDRIMMRIVRRLSNIDACEYERPISLADPDLRRYPFLYSLEWGGALLTEAEVVGLRNYLARGGFLMIDDFWGSQEWANFERNMRRVLPDRDIVEIPRTHLIYRSYYPIETEVMQIPNLGNGIEVGMGYPGARTSEGDGLVPHLRGIFDDDGKLMVAINWNTDLGDAMEWAEHPDYPLQFSRFSSELFMNTIIYAMTQ